MFVFTLPAAIRDIAYQNKAVIYDLLFKVSAETLITDRSRPQASGRSHRHHGRPAYLGLGAHPSPACAHDRCRAAHLIGRLAMVSCRPGFFLPVRVLSRLFRRLFLERLTAAHQQLQFFGQHAPLANAQAFATYLAPLRKTEWVVYSKRPFAVRRPCWPISRATPTASPSPTAA